MLFINSFTVKKVLTSFYIKPIIHVQFFSDASRKADDL